MGFTFNVCEVFHMAEEIERKGAAFYRKVVESFGDLETRRILLELADREEKHADVFAAIKKSLSEHECPPTAFDPDNEDAMYLQAMADEHVFNVKGDACTRLSGKESQQCLLKMAVELEKEALAFFLGLKAAVPTQAGKDKA